MSDLGPCHYYLGMSVRRDRPQRALFLGQRRYVERVLRDFGMWEAKPAATPMDTSKLENPEEGYVCSAQGKEWYSRAIGSLMYAMLGTRVDTAFSVSVLSRYLANPGLAHVKAVKRIMRYLKGTSHMELAFRGTLKPLVGYTDADWVGNLQTQRSTSGFLFNIGSGAISWSSKRQPTVSLSTCEAEYVAQTQATKEAIWLRSSYLSYYSMKTNQVPPLYSATTKALSPLPKTLNSMQGPSTSQFNTTSSENSKAQEPLTYSIFLQRGRWRTA